MADQAVAIEPPSVEVPEPETGVVAAAPPTGPAPTGVRGRRQSALGRLRGDIPPALESSLGVLGLLALIGTWELIAFRSTSALIPTPLETWQGIVDLQRAGDLVGNVAISLQRVAIGFGVSMVIGIVLGVLIGSFRSAEAATTSSIGFLRYIPANALTALFLLALGIDEAPKLALIIAGTVFYNVLMIGDVVRAVPKEQINAAFTLGASRRRTLLRVILPHSVPGIIDVARINLAAAWLMLVVAETAAAESGMYYQLQKLARFRNYEGVWGILLIFGAIGAVSDVALRLLRRTVGGWAQ